jgi:hypothetical protein
MEGAGSDYVASRIVRDVNKRHVHALTKANGHIIILLVAVGRHICSLKMLVDFTEYKRFKQ